METKKSITVVILFFLFLETLLNLNCYNFDYKKQSKIDNTDLELSDVFVGNYIVPGKSGSIPFNQLVRIGLLDDLEHFTGDHAWKGALMAAREINEAGGIDIYGNGTNHYIGLVAEDTNEANETLDTSKGVAAANRLINNNLPHYIIGGYRTEAVLAYQEVIMDAKIPFICTGVSTESLCQNVIDTYNRYKYFFRVMPLNSTSTFYPLCNYLGNLTQHLSSIFGGTMRKAIIIRENFVWSESLASAIEFYLNVSFGLRFEEEIAFNIGSTPTEFVDYWNTIESAGVQLAIPIVSTSDAITMLQQYSVVKPKCLLAGLDFLAKLDTYWDDTEGSCQYEILMQEVHRTAKTPLTIAFWDNFVSSYDMEPSYTGVGSYDAVKLLANVSDTINSFNATDTVSELEDFNKTYPFVGVSGNIAFTLSHDLFEGFPYSYSLFCQWQLDGKKVVVPSYVPSEDPGYYPLSLATGAISLPYWGINNLVAAQDVPQSFILSSDAEVPDKDGSFDLMWSNSVGADNYSLFIYDRNLQYISKKYLLDSYEDAISPFPISGLRTGKYYFIVSAYNANGERLSNTFCVSVDRRPGAFSLNTDAISPIDYDGTFKLTWSVSEGAENYSVYSYVSFITDINGSVNLIENQTAISPYLMSKIKTGEYYFVVQAFNATGERLSNNIYVNVDTRPKNFMLSSDAEYPVDTDGIFNLIWSVSAGADNYSVYRYHSLITEINGSVSLIENQTAISPYLISGMIDGDYFYAVMTFNETGERLSNNIYVEVRVSPGQFTLSSDAELPDTDGSFNLTWTFSARATSYSIYQYSDYISKINNSLTLITIVQASNSSYKITGLDVGFYYFIIQAYNGYNYTESNCIEVNIQSYDELTGYWEMAPFIIDDTEHGHYTWSEIVSFPWCTGSGTNLNPYVINLIQIDGKDISSCIIIRGSNISFIIKNSSFYNSGNGGGDMAGIKLFNVSNGLLIYLDCSQNNDNGISMESCQNINITSCSVNHNLLNGIFLFNCNNISIINNKDTISHNDNNGIHLIGSDSNRILCNTINYNGDNGILIDETSDNNYIDWNIFLGNGNAILNLGLNNIIGKNNIFHSDGSGFPFDILILILIITISILGTIGTAIIVKKRIFLLGTKEKEISEKKKEKIRIKLEKKLLFVDQLIKEKKLKLAYRDLKKIKELADKYGFFAIFNQANKKVEICKNIETEIYVELKTEEPIMGITTEEANDKTEIIPLIEKIEEINVFLSYSTLDITHFQIERIVKDLEKFPEINKVYYYTKDSGQNVVEFMEKTLSVCNIFVLFCTENSKESKSVRGEWQSAYQLVKQDIMKIIPVFEDEKYVPILLIPMLNVKYDKDDFSGFINKLYQEIMR